MIDLTNNLKWKQIIKKPCISYCKILYCDIVIMLALSEHKCKLTTKYDIDKNTIKDGKFTNPIMWFQTKHRQQGDIHAQCSKQNIKQNIEKTKTKVNKISHTLNKKSLQYKVPQ